MRTAVIGLAGTILATAGVLFSVLTLPLSTVTAQFGSRFLRVFLRDRINQLVEVAVRAISPAINDPFTAMTCLDYLADGLATYVRYDDISPNFFDSEGKLRLLFEPPMMTTLLGAAFDMLRHASCDNATVLLYMLDAIDVIGQAGFSFARYYYH